MTRAWILAVLCACGSDATRVHLAVDGGAVTVENFQVRIGERNALAAPLPALDVLIPDGMAGQPQAVRVWGLAAGQQIAYGTVMITPVLHGSVDAQVTLGAVSCGTFCPEGEVACAEDGTIRCDLQPTGCLAWSAVTACPASAPFCSNGACAAQCSDECATGQTTCDSAVAMRTCGEFDSDTCRDWSAPMACAANQTCTDGACTTQTSPVCEHDGDTCMDGDPCTDHDACEGGSCAGTPKCTTAPANADPTCTAGTCGFSCHTGYMASGNTCVAVPPPGKIVFVTSVNYSGNLGGLSGADAKCNALATDLPGTYKAWLSDSQTSAVERLAQSPMPYILVDGTRVADGFNGLTSGSLLHAINLDENGNPVSSAVWTDTLSDGEVREADVLYCCDDWFDGADPVLGDTGSSTAKTSSWTSSGDRLCTDRAALYCIQQ